MGTIRLFLLIAVCATFSSGLATAQHFEPLADTLNRYKILRIPDASEYPDVPAVTLLSLEEYKQLGTKHERRLHKIIKILTAAGKEYTTIRIPCYSVCTIEARTIKADGKIVNLPSKDLIRTERLTQYSSPFFLAQFAMPAVEAGDLVEYKSTVEHPYPFYVEDYTFGDSFPTLKAVFILSHPEEDSYTYSLQRPAGSAPIHALSERYSEKQSYFKRTTFVVDNVAADTEEPYSPQINRAQPGVRILVGRKTGRELAIFKDWWSYGSFLAEQATLDSLTAAPIKSFLVEAAGGNNDPATLIRLIQSEADRQIRITGDSLMRTGFRFKTPQETLADRVAAPHDFALFLAACFRHWRWKSDLVLANSHKQEAAREKVVFPADLDLVFLNVKTPAGEFLLDCNRNGIPAFAISSEAMNRFALGISLDVQRSALAGSSNVYTTKMPFRETNRSHIEFTLKPEGSVWNVDFRWQIAGDQASLIEQFHTEDEATFRKQIMQFLQSRLSVQQISNVHYRLTAPALELTGHATFPRKIVAANLEILENSLWDPGFRFRQFVLENRKSPLLLPVAGEISSTVRILIPEAFTVVLPGAFQSVCDPITYHLSFTQKKGEVQVNESLKIKDLQVKPAAFQKFGDFLDQYYANHYWSLLMSSEHGVDSTPAGGGVQ